MKLNRLPKVFFSLMLFAVVYPTHISTALAQELQGSTVEAIDPNEHEKINPAEITISDNSNTKPDRLITKERAMNRFAKGGKLRKAKLNQWRNFAKKRLKHRVPHIHPSRQVWDVETQHDSLELHGKLLKDATVTQIVDAESSDVLYVIVTVPIPGLSLPLPEVPND